MPSNPVGTQLQRVMSVLDLLPVQGEGFTARQLYDAHPWGVDHRTLLRDLAVLEELDLAQRRTPKRDTLGDSVSERWLRVPGKHPQRKRISTERAIALGLLERVSRSLLPAQVVKALHGEFEEARRHLTMQRNLNPWTRRTDKVEIVPDTFTRRPIDVKKEVLLGLQKALLADVQISARYRSRARGVGVASGRWSRARWCNSDPRCS